VRRPLFVAIGCLLSVAAYAAGGEILTGKSLPTTLAALGYKPELVQFKGGTAYNILTRYGELRIPVQLSLSGDTANLWMVVQLRQFPKGQTLAPAASEALLRVNEALALGGACYFGLAGNWVLLNCAFPNLDDTSASLKNRIDTIDREAYLTQKVWSIAGPVQH
jgi:hypothetical protein